MLKTLIKKEIIETMLDLRFWVVTALFLILIPLGMYVSRATSTHKMEGLDLYRTSIPDMKYVYSRMTEVLRTGWLDILLFFVFNVLFFSVAFWRFNKYDVR